MIRVVANAAVAAALLALHSQWLGIGHIAKQKKKNSRKRTIGTHRLLIHKFNTNSVANWRIHLRSLPCLTCIPDALEYVSLSYVPCRVAVVSCVCVCVVALAHIKWLTCYKMFIRIWQISKSAKRFIATNTGKAIKISFLSI